MPARRALIPLVALTLLPAGGALGTDGAIYSYGPGSVTNGSQWAVTTPGPNVWQVSAPALRPALAEPAFTMSWGCPAPGTEITRVLFDALRYAAASSLELQVLNEGGAVYRAPDAWIPATPAPGAPYSVELPGGSCTAHLRLAQVAQIAEQFNRTYWIGQPRLQVRDVAPPSAAIRGVTSGWIAAGRNDIRVEFTAQDNMGADGLGQQRVQVGGLLTWAGAPGPGDHGITANLDGVGDGVHVVRYEVDGDGTAGAAATGVIAVDRTPPLAGIVATKSGPATVLVNIGVGDLTSGVGRWTARIGSPDGPVIAVSEASGAAGAVVGPLDLSGYPVGTEVRFFLSATDVAGNPASTVSAPIRVERAPAAPTPPSPTRAPSPAPGAAPPASTAGTLDFGRIKMFRITARESRGAFKYCGTRVAPRPCVIVPYLVARWGRMVQIAGRYGFAPSGRGLRGATVVLTGPAERSNQLAATQTDRRGRFTVRFRPRRPGTYTVRLVGGTHDVSNPVTIAIRPVVRVTRGSQSVRVGHEFSVQGYLRPRFWAARKLLQLQFYDYDQTRWRPLANGAVRDMGRFRVRHRFGGSRHAYSVRMRIAVPRERGWRFAPSVSPPFTVSVR